MLKRYYATLTALAVVLFLLALAFGMATPAHAQTAGALSGSASYSASGAASVATQGNGNGNAQNITFNSAEPTPYVETHQSGTTTLKTVPMVYAPPVGVTAPCYTALSAGVAVVGFGLTAGGSVEDPECTLRETARLLHGIGAQEAAVRVMCNNALAAAALGAATCPPVASRRPADSSSAGYLQSTSAVASHTPICDQARRFDDRILAVRNSCPRWWKR